MQNHDGEKRRIKPRKRRVEPCDQTPRDGEVHVAGIVDLPRHLVPSITENRVARVRSDFLRIGDGFPGELGESGAFDRVTAFFGAEEFGLRVAGVPDPVHEEVG